MAGDMDTGPARSRSMGWASRLSGPSFVLLVLLGMDAHLPQVVNQTQIDSQENGHEEGQLDESFQEGITQEGEQEGRQEEQDLISGNGLHQS